MITMIVIVLAKKNKKLMRELTFSRGATRALQKQVNEYKDLIDIYEKGFINTNLSKEEMEEWINTIEKSIETYEWVSNAYIDALNEEIEEV